MSNKIENINNFKVEFIGKNKYKIFPLTKQAFFEYQRLKKIVYSIYDLLSLYSHLSKDFKQMLSDFSFGIFNYQNNCFIYDVSASKEIIEILEFLISNKSKEKVSYNKTSQKIKKDIKKANQIIGAFIIILKELNNELEKIN